jgi:hypothetical protein
MMVPAMMPTSSQLFAPNPCGVGLIPKSNMLIIPGLKKKPPEGGWLAYRE